MTNKTKLGLILPSLALTAAIAGCNGKGGDTVSPASTSNTNDAVVTVNGQAVDHNAVRDHLEATSGESAVRQLIDFALVMQEADKQGVKVTEDDVKQALDAREGQDPTVGEIRKAGGVRVAALERQTRYQVALDKIMTKDVTADDATVQKWFTSHAKYYDQPERVKLGILLAQTKNRADLMASQLKSKAKTFQELVDEQKKSTDMAGHNSQTELPSLTAVSVFPAPIKSAIDKVKEGETSAPVTLGAAGQGGVFAIIKVVQRIPAVKADYAKMKSLAMNDYKLEQVAMKLNKENPNNPPFEKTVDQVKAVMMQQAGPNMSYRSILDFINNTEVTKLLSKLRSEAKVEIKDKSYDKIGEEFKALNAAKLPETPASAPAASAPAPAPAAPAKP